MYGPTLERIQVRPLAPSAKMSHTSSSATVKSVGALLELTITAKRTITNDKLESSATHCIKIKKNDKNLEEKLKNFLELTELEKCEREL